MTIRFEMPFNVWCETCLLNPNGTPIFIAKGVRYNAEKKKIGNYYSSPIFQFTMNCHNCIGKFVIETDPKACDYKLVSGVKRKNEQWDPEEEGSQVIALPNEEDKMRLMSDPIFRLEHTAEVSSPIMNRLPQH